MRVRPMTPRTGKRKRIKMKKKFRPRAKGSPEKLQTAFGRARARRKRL